MIYKNHRLDPSDHRYDNSLRELHRGPLAGVLKLEPITLEPEAPCTWLAMLEETFLVVAVQLPTDHRLGNLTLTIKDRNRASHWLGTSARQLAPHNLPLPVPGLVWLSRLALEITGRHHGLTWTGSPRLVLHKL